jgi:hypothetical protein
MPVIGLGQQISAPRMRVGITPNAQQANTAVDYAVTQDRNPLAVLGGVAGLGAVDLADTIASSIPGLSSALGVDRGDLNRQALGGINHALTALDLPGLGDFYHDYKGGIEITSAVYGTVAAELVSRKLTAPAGAVMGVLGRLPYARRVAALDAQYATAMQTVRAVDMNLAARGALGAEQYVGRTVVFGPSAVTDITRDAAVKSAKRLGFVKGARNAAVTEGVMALALNQNGFLYDDSAAHNMAWMGLGLGIGGAAEWLHSAYQIRKFVNSDEIRRTFAGALDPQGDEASRLLWAADKGVKADERTMFLGGLFSDRATNLLVNARNLTEGVGLEGSEAIKLAANRSQLATQHLKLAREEMQKLTNKGIHTDGRTRFNVDDSGVGNHLDMLVHRDPAALYGVEQLGRVDDELSPGLLHERHTTRLQELIDEAEETLGSMLDEEGGLLDEADPKEYADTQRWLRRLEFESQLTPMAVVDRSPKPKHSLAGKSLRLVSARTSRSRAKSRGRSVTSTDSPKSKVKILLAISRSARILSTISPAKRLSIKPTSMT